MDIVCCVYGGLIISVSLKQYEISRVQENPAPVRFGQRKNPHQIGQISLIPALKIEIT